MNANFLSLLGDRGELARINITREDGGFGDDWAGGDLSSQGGNLYLEIDGKEIGSLWITYDDNGAPKITLGQYDPKTGDWEERSAVQHIADDQS